MWAQTLGQDFHWEENVTHILLGSWYYMQMGPLLGENLCGLDWGPKNLSANGAVYQSDALCVTP